MVFVRTFSVEVSRHLKHFRENASEGTKSEYSTNQPARQLAKQGMTRPNRGHGEERTKQAGRARGPHRSCARSLMRRPRRGGLFRWAAAGSSAGQSHGESASVLEVSVRAFFLGAVSSSRERPLRPASRFFELLCFLSHC